MSRSKEPFAPRPDQGNKVAMYVCGVTVYDYSHIGTAGGESVQGVGVLRMGD